DLTESPITVDAGHFQVEMDLFAFSYDRDTTDQGDTRVISYGIAPINLKVGLLNHLDAQLILETWTIRRIEDRVTGRVINQSGFGDVIPRLKLNLWGNDGGRTAAAIMPFVKIPTNQDRLGNNAFEGGLIVPFGVELPKEFGLGLMAEVDVIQDESGNGYHPEFINTIAIGHSIVGNLGAYIEFFSLVSTEAEADWIGSVDVGFGYSFTPDVRLDAGVNIGVTPATDDWNPFVGISFRY
ncbi:MAG TPA: transporter, partial [Clostridia bacterium]|nr:transporter [Clostridia bacterium]